MPINNFIVATEPLGTAAHDILPMNVAVSDARFVVNYFRLSHDNRLLFGGGESYGYKFPADIAGKEDVLPFLLTFLMFPLFDLSYSGY